MFPIDTHCSVILRRLGFVDREDDYEMMRRKIERLVPKEERGIASILFVEFGKDVCLTRRPKCNACPIKEFCEMKI
jgi:endonuclease-3